MAEATPRNADNRVPWPNRVSPRGDIVSVDARGTLWGNRGGCLHDDAGRIVRTHASRAWITCLLEYKGRWHPVMPPGRFTGLFFLDEATALAAGHRPCFQCRYADAMAFAAAVAAGQGRAGGARLRAPEMDALLHPLRRPVGAGRPTWPSPAATLPDGTMVVLGGEVTLLVADSARRWSFHGYGAPEPRPAGEVDVLTPEPTVRALVAGYRLALHPSAE